ncbi:hypothetical protein QL285_043929 [Trifolium repens]|nr:hypothetical protein QL285_043929 [Trifolium repens]
MESEDMANLSLNGGEDEGFDFAFEEDEEAVEDLRWCLIGRFLCERTIHVNSMMVRMANIWQPVKGVTIKEVKAGLFLFRFNHQLDMEEVLKNGPWTFDNNLLIMERVLIGTQIESIPLFHTDFWVQIHGLPVGLMKETVGSKLGNYIGSFVEYDKNNNSSFWRQYMRLRVKIDVRVPLKKETKVKDRNGVWCTVKFKYERLGIFCFICGVMGHSDNKCSVRFDMPEDDGRRDWSSELRAEPRKTAGRPVSRWLKEEGGGVAGVEGSSDGGRGGDLSGGTVGGFHGNRNNEEKQVSGESSMSGPTNLNSPNNNPHQLIISSHNTPFNKFIPNKGAVSSPLSHSRPTHLILSQNQSPQPSIDFCTDIHNQPVKSDLSPFQSLTQPTYTSPIKINSPIITPIMSNQDLSPHLATVTIPKDHSFPFSFQADGTHTETLNPIHNKTLVSVPRNHITKHQPSNRTKAKPTQKTRTGPHMSNPSPVQPAHETQIEKKRRREMETEGTDASIPTGHFLSAGPGSQDCRDK